MGKDGNFFCPVIPKIPFRQVPTNLPPSQPYSTSSPTASKRRVWGKKRKKLEKLFSFPRFFSRGGGGTGSSSQRNFKRFLRSFSPLSPRGLPVSLLHGRSQKKSQDGRFHDFPLPISSSFQFSSKFYGKRRGGGIEISQFIKIAFPFFYRGRTGHRKR